MIQETRNPCCAHTKFGRPPQTPSPSIDGQACARWFFSIIAEIKAFGFFVCFGFCHSLFVLKLRFLLYRKASRRSNWWLMVVIDRSILKNRAADFRICASHVAVGINPDLYLCEA